MFNMQNREIFSERKTKNDTLDGYATNLLYYN